jgi:hypothetical protein
MGLLSSGDSEEFNKFKKISSKDAKSILGYMNPKHKQKVKKYLKDVDKENKSIHQVSQEIQENIGSEMKRKFIHAAKKHAGGGLTKKEKRRNLARRREEIGEGVTGYVRSTASFAGGEVESSHRVSMQKDAEQKHSVGAGLTGSGEKRGVSINNSSQGERRGGFANSQKSSFADGNKGHSGSNSKKKGGSKPLGL